MTSDCRGVRQRGQALVELAFVMPLLLVMFMGAVDLGRALFVHVALEQASQEGILYRSHNPTASTAAIQDRVRWSSTAAEVANASVGVPPCSPTNLTVTASYAMPVLTPVVRQLLGGTITITGSATGRNFKATCS